ncbi:MFS family permease [Paraburkholderia youngii]|uniref:MFS transporter n=1 Tax=Paraburkholderia youngii TaxID=2782701 RepID=UPI003D23A4F9
MSKLKSLDELFDGRHFDREIIILCVRWYLRYKLSLRDLVEMMAERGLSLAHTTILRWVQRYAPEFVKRWNRFGTGIFTVTATVAVIELVPPAWRGKAMLAATASNMLGLGCGPLLSGILVELFPWPRQLPYAVHLALVGIAALAVLSVPETAAIPARVKLGIQRISLPIEVGRAFIPAALAGFAGFVVVGFFAAVAPQLIRIVLGFHSGVVTGAIVFLLFACSACGQIVQTMIAARWRQAAGCVGLVVGLVCVGLCVPQQSLVALLLGTALAGIGQGISFRAGLGEIASAAPAHRRAEVTSSYFVVLYVAISLPVIGLGIAVQVAGIQRATLLFVGLTIIVVLIALLILMRGQANREPVAHTIGD